MRGDGFFRRGDIGVMSPDGFTKIVDSKKDMIIVSGFNVYPNEVEEVIASHSGSWNAPRSASLTRNLPKLSRYCGPSIRI